MVKLHKYPVSHWAIKHLRNAPLCSPATDWVLVMYPDFGSPNSEAGYLGDFLEVPALPCRWDSGTITCPCAE